MARQEYIKKEFSKELRKEQTEAERKVWEVLRNRKFLGLKFRRQYVIKGFVVDFYCDKKDLVIEVDGKVHEDQKEYDNYRQAQIELRVKHFIRIKNEELKDDISVLLNKIGKKLNVIPPSPGGC